MMALTVEQIARICHEANRTLQLIQGDPNPSPSWETAEQWQIDSAINGVEQSQIGVDSEELHEAWMLQKRLDGWVYGAVKDADKKTHPCLVPYEQLPEEQRLKDDLFNAIVDVLSLP